MNISWGCYDSERERSSAPVQPLFVFSFPSGAEFSLVSALSTGRRLPFVSFSFPAGESASWCSRFHCRAASFSVFLVFSRRDRYTAVFPFSKRRENGPWHRISSSFFYNREPRSGGNNRAPCLSSSSSKWRTVSYCQEGKGEDKENGELALTRLYQHLLAREKLQPCKRQPPLGSSGTRLLHGALNSASMIQPL